MVGHIGKLIQFQLVRLIHAVHLVNMLHVLLEHIETLMLLLQVPRNSVVAPPPLVQVPESLFGTQVLLLEVKALGNPQK